MSRSLSRQPSLPNRQVEPPERVKQYILNQEKHHQNKTSQEEYLEMLKLAGIEYDERYVW
jgi:hypothetical protein